MGLESVDCKFCYIAPVHMGGHYLERYFTVFLDGTAVVCAVFIVEDLEVYFVATLLDAPAEGVIGGKAVAVVLGAERFN